MHTLHAWPLIHSKAITDPHPTLLPRSAMTQVSITSAPPGHDFLSPRPIHISYSYGGLGDGRVEARASLLFFNEAPEDARRRREGGSASPSFNLETCSRPHKVNVRQSFTSDSHA